MVIARGKVFMNLSKSLRKEFDMRTNIEQMKVDVCIVTKNVENLSPRLLDKIHKLPLNKLIIETSRPLGMARQRAISQVETDWFLFIDDDVIIGDRWFQTLVKYISLPKVGAIEGIAPVKGLGKKWEVPLNSILPKKVVEVPKNKWARGYTHNTLIRTSLVKDWRPSSKLQAFEDLALTKHIQLKGYKWIKVPAQVYHVQSWSKIRNNALWHGKTMTFYAGLLECVFRIMKAVIYIFRCAFDFILLPHSCGARQFYIMQNFHIVIGFVRGLPSWRHKHLNIISKKELDAIG